MALELTKAWKKMVLNSVYPRVVPTHIKPYDPMLAEKVTQAGKENLQKLLNENKWLKESQE